MNFLKGPFHLMALLGWLHLIGFAVLWDSGAWVWVTIKLIPLLLLLPGITRARSFTMQLASMVVLLYMVEGCVRGMTSPPPSNLFGWAQFVLSWIAFFGLILYLRPLKKAAKLAKAESAASQSPAEQVPKSPKSP